MIIVMEDHGPEGEMFYDAFDNSGEVLKNLHNIFLDSEADRITVGFMDDDQGTYFVIHKGREILGKWNIYDEKYFTERSS